MTFSFGGSYGVQDKIDVLLQPDLHTTIAVGLAAFLLAFSDFLRQRQISIRHVHSFDVIVISAAKNVEETAHLTDGILISMTVDHHILNFVLHILSVSERKSRNNSFSSSGACFRICALARYLPVCGHAVWKCLGFLFAFHDKKVRHYLFVGQTKLCCCVLPCPLISLMSGSNSLTFSYFPDITKSPMAALSFYHRRLFLLLSVFEGPVHIRLFSIFYDRSVAALPRTFPIPT